jgi:2-aminoadipate transaminase
MNWKSLFAERTTRMRRSAVRELLKVIHRPEMISFAGGIPAPELFPIEETAWASARTLVLHGEAALQYGETEGVAALRDWIAARFSRPGFQVRRENVMIVTGSQQALDLIGKVFLNAGDRVLVENPTYLAMLSAWRPMEPDFVPVPSDAEGMCVDALPPLLNRGAKLIYVVPNFQNPQGTTLGLPRRRKLVHLLYGRLDPQTILIEDDPYGELRYSGDALPHLFEVDAVNAAGGALETRVIYLGSFSKILAPGLRVGWVIAPAEVIDKLVQAKQAADLHTSTFCQHIILELIRDGVLGRQIPRLREAYRARRDAMLSALAEHFPAGTSWTRPDGGMFLLVKLPAEIDAGELLKCALAKNVAFVPGREFHVDDSGGNSLRLNFSNATPEKIVEGVRRLAGVLKERASVLDCGSPLPLLNPLG